MNAEVTEPKPAERNEAAAPAAQAAGRFAQWPLSLALFVSLFIFDHATKWWAAVYLQGTEEHPPRVITIIPGLFDFRYAENTGAAFSIGTGKTGLLAIVSLVASLGFAWFWYTLPAREKWGRAAVALILSGAIGNLIDRAFRGYVIDFLHVFYKDWHYPIFNIADSAICVGAAILAVRLLQKKI